jgi:hypothetical protein
MATTGSNLFKGDQTISGSIIPSVNNTYDLGSPTQQFRHVYISSGSLYVNGAKVLGSTAQELQITTDAGQSFKILEAGSDTITLQSADGNITLATSGGGDVILDPTSGIIALKGSTQVYAGNRILSSDGNAIHFGNGVTISGSLLATGTNLISGSGQLSGFGLATTGSNNFIGTQTITGSLYISANLVVQGSSSLQDVTGSNVYIGTNKVNLNTNTPSIRFGGISVFDSGSNFGESGSLLWDSQNNRWVYQHPYSSGAPYKSAIIISGPQNSGSLGDEQNLTTDKIQKAVGNDHIGDSIITETGGGIGISGSLSITGSIVATGTSLWSGSGQLPSGIISSSAQLPSGTVSGSVQVDVMSTTNIARLATTGSNVFTGALTGTSATFSSTLKVGGANGNFLMDSYTTSKIGIRSWTDISGTTNNFFVQNSANYNYGIIGVISASGTATGDVYGLGYSPSAGTSMTPVLNWTSAGYVGIGNTNPLGSLHIGAALASSGDAAALILKQTSTNETTGIYLERSGERKGYAIYVGGSLDSLVFQRNNAGTKSDVLTLTRDGNVGINQSDPTGLGGPSFVVAGSGYPEVIVEKTGANARKWGFTVGSDGSYLLRDYTSGANVFTVNTSGTGNFNSNITVNGNTVWHSANDGSGSGLDADLLDGRDSGGYMTQTQGGIEFLQGSYTGWYKLARSSQASGGAGLRGSFKIIVAATGNYLTPSQDEITGFKDWTTNASISSIASTADSIFQNYRITYDSDYSYLEGYVSYYFGGNQSIVINSYVNGLNGLTWSPYTGTVQASSTSSGAVSIGKVNNGFTVPYLRSAAGIKFGSGSGTLNYYEEGTFTPSSLGTNFSSVSVVHGKYVRIGNQITVNCKWTVTPGGTGRNYIVFNLPFAFAVVSSNGFTGAVSNYNEGASAYSSNVGTTVRNSSSSDTQQYVEASYISTGANTSLQLMMTYFTF